MKVRVEVFLKAGVLDVQGKAIEAALSGLGFKGVSDVRVGRIITFDSAAADRGAADRGAAEADAKAMADKLLANQVIESYRVEVA